MEFGIVMNKLILTTSSLLFIPSMTFASALDRSGQSVSEIWKDGTYAEISYNITRPEVQGKDKGLGTAGVPNETSNLAENSSSLRWAVKSDINEKFSIGIIYDQPFSINIQHHGKSDFNSTLADGSTEGTKAQFDSHNFTSLIGWNLNPKIMLFAGPSLQEIEGEVKLRGQVYKSTANYNASLKSDKAVGWVAGAVFKKSEIGLRTALTYRSEINHKTHTTEAFTGISSEKYFNPVTFTTPESFNFDFQTGLSKSTLLNLNVRWVPWSDFAFKPYKLYQRSAANSPTKKGVPLLSYEEDQWSAQLGLSHKLNPKWAISTSVSWDSGLGDPANALGPVNGYWGTGIGVQYNLSKEVAVALGGKYLWLGDAQAKRSNGDIIGEFSDNNNIGFGLKLSYQHK